ncbi:MAG: carboxypeptidase-like regulatory domain-containing protein [Candidatus Heimdallarchaeaceae archaeon]|jgi:hypothetical protein
MSKLKKQSISLIVISIMMLSLIFTTTNLTAFRNITVSGHVVNDRTGSGTGIGPVKIKVYSWYTLSKEYVKTEYSNTNGYYSFQLSLGLGPYELEFSKVGYFLSEEYMLFELPEPVRLIPIIDYQVDIDFTNINPTKDNYKGDPIPLSFNVKNMDNYYKLTDLDLNIKIESTGWLFSDPQYSHSGFEDFVGWLKIPLSFSLNPGQTESNVNVNIPSIFTLYDAADTSPVEVGLFALNYGEYNIDKYALTGVAKHDSRSTGAFYSDETGQTNIVNVLKSTTKDFVFIYSLYDSWWRYGDDFLWEGTGYTPSWFFYTGDDDSVNSKFDNQFSLEYQVYDQIFFKTTNRPTTNDEWKILAIETLAPDFLGLSGGEWDIDTSVIPEWLSRNNHGFDMLILSVGEIGENWGFSTGNFICTFVLRPGWIFGYIENNQVDNLLQHELSHQFGAPDHDGWFDDPSVMTYFYLPTQKYFINQDNWLDLSSPFDDITVMSNKIASYWIYKNPPS